MLPSSNPLQTEHSQHGSPSLVFKQFIALENILAQVVFPVPLDPVKRYA